MWYKLRIIEDMTDVKEQKVQELTGMQQKFVDEYCISLNATQATLKAGYSKKGAEKQGFSLKNKPHIKAAIAERLKEAASKSHVTPEWVLMKISKTINAAEAEGKHNEVLRGCELLGRHHSLFVDRTEISGKDGEAIQYEERKKEASDFTSTVLKLAARNGEKRVSGES